LKTLLLWSLLIPAVASASPSICHRALGHLEKTAGYSLLHEAKIYEQMLSRLRATGTPRNQSHAAFNQLTRTFLSLGRTIHNSLYEGYFLKGVVVWADSLEDIQFANTTLHAGGELLNYFASRTAYLAFHFDKSIHEYTNSRSPKINHRNCAIESARHFDLVSERSFSTRFDTKLGTLTIQPLLDQSVEHLRRQGLNISRSPFTEYGLHFNHGRDFPYRGYHPHEQWVATRLAATEPSETLLALGDPSTSQFLGYVGLFEGKMVRVGSVADLLSVTHFGFIVREIKWSKPESDIHITNALSQLRHTMTRLRAQWPNVPISQVEIVIPHRERKVINSQYQRGETPSNPSNNLFNLLHAPSWTLEQVHLDIDGIRYPVLIRMIDDIPEVFSPGA